jgi:Binding-protein-dependent transport system inner membrane component
MTTTRSLPGIAAAPHRGPSATARMVAGIHKSRIAVTVISILTPSLMVVILMIGLLRWMDYARVLRGEVLRLAATDFVHLAIVAGCSRWRISGRHIFPNLNQYPADPGHPRHRVGSDCRGDPELPGPGNPTAAALLGDHAGRIAKIPLRCLVAALDSRRGHQLAGDGKQPCG